MGRSSIGLNKSASTDPGIYLDEAPSNCLGAIE